MWILSPIRGPPSLPTIPQGARLHHEVHHLLDLLLAGPPVLKVLHIGLEELPPTTVGKLDLEELPDLIAIRAEEGTPDPTVVELRAGSPLDFLREKLAVCCFR